MSEAEEMNKVLLKWTQEFERRGKELTKAKDRIEKMDAILTEIERISCGEDQVADDDTEGMEVIYKKIVEYQESPL